MSNVRKHFRVIIAGEKIETETNALDMVRAERDGQGPAAHGLRTVHAALIRQRVPNVPPKFETFLEQLDDFEDLDDDDTEDAAELDPIPPTD